MKRLLFYGDDLVSVDIPDSTSIVNAPAPEPGFSDYESEVRAAIRNPLGSLPLKELVTPSSRVTIAFDDPCLPVPLMRNDLRGRAIGVILDELSSAGIAVDSIKLICANGLHRKWKYNELRFVLGKRICSEIRAANIRNHDAEDPDEIAFLGQTAEGHPVRLNSAVTQSDLLIYVNINCTSMNGGWKSVLVGLGDYESIKAHHNVKVLSEGGSVMDHRAEFHDIIRSMGRIVEEQARVFTVETVINTRVWGRLEGRLLSVERSRLPLAFKVAARLPQRLKSMTISRLRSAYEPMGVNAGSVSEVHDRTLESLYGQQTVKVAEQFDVLILGVPNSSPYAAFSGMNPVLVANTALGYVFNMHRGKPAVKKGGVLILVQPFLPGFDMQHHPSYAEFFERVLPVTTDPAEMEAQFEADFAGRLEYIDKYRFANAYHGVHPFYAWYWAAAALDHLGRVIAVGARDPSITARMGFDNARSIEEALVTASETLGGELNVGHLVMPPVFLTDVR